MDFTPLLKTFVDAKVEGLVSNMDYLENRLCNFIQKEMWQKKTAAAHTRFVTSFFWVYTANFLLVRTFYTVDDS